MEAPKYRLEFTLNGLPPTTNGSHGNHFAVAAEKKKWRNAAKMAAYFRRPEVPLSKAKLILTRCSSVPTDFDNRVISFKPIVDGLKDAGIILDDTDKVIVSRDYPMEKAPRGKGKIRVRVEEVA